MLNKYISIDLKKTTINMSKARNQAHFKSIPPDERRKVREKKFRQSPEDPKPKLQEQMINSKYV